MRLIYIFLSVFLSLPVFSSAQNIYLGLQGGISMSNVYGSGEAHKFHNMRQGWGGAYAEFLFGKHWGVYTAINLHEKGWKEEPRISTNQIFLYKQAFRNLTQPIMGQYSWGEKIRTSVRLGAYISYHFQQEIARVERLVAWPTPNDRLIAPDYTPVQADRVDWGAAAGLGVEYALGSKFSLGLQSNFQLALKNVGREIDWRGPSVPVKHIYGDIGISLGYQLVGKK